ncbi:MAG: PGF-pre-PGF domain-containing protein [Methanosarcinales archaeon]|nr:MAG: PGF-pre-PGF domain-containing protein [Methanosarcinales archaeon]
MAKRETRDQYLYANRDVTYSFTTPELAIYEIVVSATKSTNLISARIELLKGTSTLVDAPPEGTVYKNLNIWLGTYGFATPENIEDATISFKVEKSWLTDNKLSKNDISLAKWESGNWIELSTTLLKDDSDYVYYEVHTTSFSPFAIVGKFVPTVPESTVTEPVSTESAEPEPTDGVSTEGEDEEDERSWLPGFTSVFAITGLFAVAYAMMRRRRN